MTVSSGSITMLEIESGYEHYKRLNPSWRIVKLWKEIFDDRMFNKETIEICGPYKEGIDLVFNQLIGAISLPRSECLAISGEDMHVLCFTDRHFPLMINIATCFHTASSKLFSVKLHCKKFVEDGMNNVNIVCLRDYLSNSVIHVPLINFVVLDIKIKMIALDNINIINVPHSTPLWYLDRVRYVKNMITKEDIILIFKRYNCFEINPRGPVFKDVDIILNIERHKEKGLKITHSEANFKRVIFTENTDFLLS